MNVREQPGVACCLRGPVLFCGEGILRFTPVRVALLPSTTERKDGRVASRVDRCYDAPVSFVVIANRPVGKAEEDE